MAQKLTKKQQFTLKIIELVHAKEARITTRSECRRRKGFVQVTIVWKDKSYTRHVPARLLPKTI